MIIIVESGATKSDWRVIGEDGRQIAQCILPGMNVSSMRLDAIRSVLEEGLTELRAELTRLDEGYDPLDGASFYLYTAGVVTDPIREDVRNFVLSRVSFKEFDMQNDLVGAARSVLGLSRGIAAIMGTGSNTCFYDGETVTQNVLSGGYVIGDDGSAAALGKLFLADYIKNLIPSDVAEDFASKFDASYSGIVENVYRSESPSGYLGSLAPFILSHYDNPHIEELVNFNFKRFIDRSLKQYDTTCYPVGIVGGFGFACRDIFAPMCVAAGIRIAGFLAQPIDGLVKYHCNANPVIR